jgi:hypothetical protein
MHATQELVADPATPAHTLRAAARYLLDHGWYQGDLFANLDQIEVGELTTPAACALGAIHVCVRGTPVPGEWTPQAVDAFDQAVAAMADFLILNYGVDDPHVCDILNADAASELELVVSEWNDAQSRIASHVIAALYGAADEWERQHLATAGGAA